MSPESITPPAVVDAERSTGVEPGTGQGGAQNRAQGVAECPWPVGTILRSDGESGVFRWIFQHVVPGRWYETGRAKHHDWAYVAQFPNLVELVPAANDAHAMPDQSPVGTDTATPAAPAIMETGTDKGATR